MRRTSQWWALDEPVLTRLDKTLCGLEWKEPYWTGSTTVGLFRPEGLLVVGAPPGSKLVEWMIGNERALPAGAAGVFLSVWGLMEEVESQTGKSFRARPRLSVMEPGVLMRLKLVGPTGELLGPPCEPTVWGFTPNYL